MSTNNKISNEEYKRALELLKQHEDMVERLKKITRAYIYQEESERVQDRKKQAAIDNSKK